MEDLYLNSLYFMHAQKYVGSHVVGYAYSYVEKNLVDACERATYTYAMRTELIPYMAEIGFSGETALRYVAYLENYISLCIGRLAIAVGKAEGADIRDETVHSLLKHSDVKTLIKVLLLGNCLNAEKLSAQPASCG